MLRALIFFCVCAAPALAEWEKALKVTFGVNPFDFGRTVFVDLPQTNSSATTSRWVRTQGPELPSKYPPGVLQLWCPYPDHTICVYYDDTGYVSGMLINVDKEKFSDGLYDMKTQGFKEWSPVVNGVTKNYWSTYILFFGPEFLAIPAATRIANRNTYVLLQDRNVVVSGFNGDPYSISTRINDFTTGASDFTQQACIPWMGRHWYYKMTKTTECKADTVFPWFPLTYDNQLIGLGRITIGKHATTDRDWFEKPDSAAVKMIVNNGPQCLYDLADSPGIFTLHTYFIRHPYQMTCLFN